MQYKCVVNKLFDHIFCILVFTKSVLDWMIAPAINGAKEMKFWKAFGGFLVY